MRVREAVKFGKVSCEGGVGCSCFEVRCLMFGVLG